MEKTVVFLPLIIFGGFFALMVVGFFFLVLKLVKKGKDSEWKGKLVEKKYVEGEDFDSGDKKDYYTLIFETGEGKRIKVGTDRGTYDEYKVDDQAEKVKGEFRPRKL